MAPHLQNVFPELMSPSPPTHNLQIYKIDRPKIRLTILSFFDIDSRGTFQFFPGIITNGSFSHRNIPDPDPEDLTITIKPNILLFAVK